MRIGVPFARMCGLRTWSNACESGAEMILVPNGSPFRNRRLNLVPITESGLPMVYLNQIGGQDELVFDGASFVLNADRTLAHQMPAWREQVRLTHWTRGAGGWTVAVGECGPIDQDLEAVYQAMVLGLRDYVRKNGFPGGFAGPVGGDRLRP